VRQKKRSFALTVMANALFCAVFFINSGYADGPRRALKPGNIQENIYGSALLSDTECLLVGDRGKIFRSMDNGKIWQEIPSGVRLPLFSVSFADSKNGWISGKSGTILHTTDGGLTWSKQESGKKKHLFSISFGDAQHGCAVGDWGAIVITEDGGSTWQDVSLTEDVVLYGVQFTGSKSGWVVGEFGKIFSTENGGRTWREIPQKVADRSLFSLSVDEGSLFAAGLDGIVVYSKDGGKNWLPAEVPVKKSIYGIAFREKIGWAVGNEGTVLRSRDGGKTWQKVDLPMAYRLFWLGTVSLRSSSNDATGFVGGAHGLFFRISPKGLEWESKGGGE
jgi:photosystem II stability/assembly factor-like uncharacterized protein